MNPNKALREKGDFTEIAAFMRQAGEAVVSSIVINPPVRSLDLGSGEELHQQLLELAKSQNQSKNGGTFIPASFLRVTVAR
jgi:hypothetical protein